MSTPIQPTSGTSAPSTSSAAKTASTTPSTSVDKNMFLKLMVAQLKGQDPTSPTDSSQWLSQMAQFSTVEQLTNIATTSADAATSGKMTEAVGLVGRTVAYDDGKGSTGQGTVQSVTVGKSGPTLTVGGQAGIDPSTLTDVR